MISLLAYFNPYRLMQPSLPPAAPIIVTVPPSEISPAQASDILLLWNRLAYSIRMENTRPMYVSRIEPGKLNFLEFSQWLATHQKALASLTELDLSKLRLQSLPVLLTNVRKLDLSDNHLTSLKEFGQLRVLEELNLSRNELTELPVECCQLAKLKKLTLTQNKLTSLPKEFANLQALEELGLTYNNFTALPLICCQIAQLKRLLVQSNQLEILSQEIRQLWALEVLDLNNNSLSSLPPGIGSLINLHTLFVENNRLTQLPKEINHLVKLDRFWIENNKLTELPPMENLKKLIDFRCSENMLTELPASLFTLNNCRITIYRNPLSPATMETLQNPAQGGPLFLL
jgi:Leucine-rich repeat (LRR) protein